MFFPWFVLCFLHLRIQNGNFFNTKQTIYFTRPYCITHAIDGLCLTQMLGRLLWDLAETLQGIAWLTSNQGSSDQFLNIQDRDQLAYLRFLWSAEKKVAKFCDSPTIFVVFPAATEVMSIKQWVVHQFSVSFFFSKKQMGVETHSITDFGDLSFAWCRIS